MIRVFLLVPVLVSALPALAQHATAFDVQDGRRVYEGLCAACHGPDGNLIAGIEVTERELMNVFGR